ncbi:MAG: aldehyde ferredoxin oxidoreductase C-terminal domain-containing protein, partial [Bacillota bacterium]
MGIKAVVVEDSPRQPATRVLVITTKGVKLEEMPSVKGATVSTTFRTLRGVYGPDIGIICIGPAGEMMMYGAGVAVTDDKDVQVRYAARGGLGALMGSKGIKAIVIDDAGAPPPEFFDETLVSCAARDVAKALAGDPKTQIRHAYGTPGILRVANQVGLLPTRNFSSGQFELANEIDGERVAEVIAKRQGEGCSGTPCVKGCVIRCSNVFPSERGTKVVASLQYESIVLLGPNCGIGNLDDIAELTDLCNQVGVDTIETGAAIGVAMEAGVVKFGDAEGAKSLVRQIGQGTYLGRILGHGAALTGRVLGVRRVPTVKGQAIPAYDPRALKGNG